MVALPLDDKVKDPSSSAADGETYAPRFAKPKILLLDLPASVQQTLRSAGYNATSGTLGRPYRVKKSDGFVPVIVSPHVPNFAEQDLVFVDLQPTVVAENPEGEKLVSGGEPDWFASASGGLVDPRMRTMDWLRGDADRILAFGGAFVFFADAPLAQWFVEGQIVKPFIQLEFRKRRDINVSHWSAPSPLRLVTMRPESGSEIAAVAGHGALTSFLERHLSQATFTATLHWNSSRGAPDSRPAFVPLALNRFGEVVAAAMLPEAGFVLLLPHFGDKERGIADLVDNVFPELRPGLFPHHEGTAWVHRDEYEHPSVLTRKATQLLVRQRAAEEIERLNAEIDSERDRWEFLHGILTKSGDLLVADVKRALEFIGFTTVVDVDAAGDATANKQEDLQVLDGSPSILVEVKGLLRLPREGDTFQVTKYVNRRIKQWNRTDIVGLSLINHQRNLPPLERDNVNVFTEAQIHDAIEAENGLMTTWDLFRLIRGMVKWNWPIESVIGLFYDKGRLAVRPSHYSPIGVVAHYYTKRSVITIDVSHRGLNLGDVVGYALVDGFFQEPVTSLEVNRTPVAVALPGSRAGMQTTLQRADIPVGTQVFRVGRFGT